MAADPNYDPTEFQDVLRREMDRRGHSQQAAADTMDVSQAVLNRWLKPKGDSLLLQPRSDSLEKVVPYVRLSLTELKRMTGRLTPADLELYETATAKRKPNTRLEAFLKLVAEHWDDLSESKREDLETVNRALLGLHHGRGRGRRHNPGRGNTQEESDSSKRKLLLAV